MRTGKPEIIKMLAEYVGEPRAIEDLEQLYSVGIESKFLKSVIPCMKFRWNIDKVLEFKDLCKVGKIAKIIYSLKYWMLKYNVDSDEAAVLLNDFKKNKATNKENFIKKHGTEKGKVLFEKFQKTSASSTSKVRETLIAQYGETLGLKKFREELKSRSRFSYLFYMKRYNMSEEEAREKARVVNIQQAGISYSYYKNKGLSDEDVEEILENINSKKGNTPRSRQYYKNLYGENWETYYMIYTNNFRSYMEKKNAWIPSEELDKFVDYKRRVYIWTNLSISSSSIANIELRGRNYHLDHMYSIKEGFINNIDPEIIGSKYNLRIISASENNSKRTKCSIELDTLLKFYHENKNN